MTIPRIAAVALAFGLTFAAGATAAGGGVGAPTTSPAFEAFAKGLEGTWKCESTVPAGTMGPGSPELKFQGTARLKRDLDGMWVVGRLDIKRTKTHPPFTGAFSFGTDGKQFIASNIDSRGNAGLTFGALTDPANITTTGEGTAMGAKVKVRETTRRKSDKELYHMLEIDVGKGFVVAGEDTCKK